MKFMFDRAVIACLAMTVQSGVFAENARTDAMGGVSIINDFGHVLYFPASINDFPDQVTGTSGSASDTAGNRIDYMGPIMGKKSLGKLFNIGFVANTVDIAGSSVLRSRFYDEARSFLITRSGDSLPTAFPMMPHVLLGLDFGAVTIGCEGYYEFSHRRRIVADSDRHDDIGIRNVGGVLSATVTLGNAWLCPLAGIGAPTIFGEKRDSSLTTFESVKASSATAGMEVGAEFPSFTPVAGLFYTKEEYSFRSKGVASPEYSAIVLDFYAGFSAQLLDSLLLAVEYDANLYFDDIADTNAPSRSEYHDAYGYHGLHLGMERPFKATGIFDEVILRSGLAYYFTTAKDQWGDSVVYHPLAADDMQLSAGIGFRKDVFCLDLFVNLGNWNGVLTGPRAMSATLTVGLSRKFLGGESSN